MASARRIGTNEQIATGGDNTRTHDFDAGGLATWEALTDTNHVADNETDVLECYDDSASFDDEVEMDGSTNDATRFRIIRPASGEGHDGTSNNGVYFSSTTDSDTLKVSESDSALEDLIGTLTLSTATIPFIFRANASDVRLVGCIGFDGSNSGSGDIRGIGVTSASVKLVLCLAENNDEENYRIQPGAGNTAYVYNCVGIDSIGQPALVNVNGTVVCKNCLMESSGGGTCFESGTYTGSDFNSAGDATDPDSGANNRVSQTFSFVNTAGNDYHITYSDLGAHDFGQDLSGDGVFAFDDDIDGTLWDAWDIGFNEPGGPFTRDRALSTEDAGNVTSHTVQLPSSIEAGDTILAVFACDGNKTVTWPNEGTEWIELDTTPNGSACTLSVAWKKADGTEDGTTIEVTTSGGGERSSHSVLCIGGAEDPDTTPPDVPTAATGASANPDPPTNSNAVSNDYMFVAGIGVDRDRTVTAIPTNYGNENTQAGGGANSATCSTAERQLTTGSDENPGTFTISASDQWVATTVQIHPPAGVVIPALIPRRTSFGQEMRLRR